MAFKKSACTILVALEYQYHWCNNFKWWAILKLKKEKYLFKSPWLTKTYAYKYRLHIIKTVNSNFNAWWCIYIWNYKFSIYAQGQKSKTKQCVCSHVKRFSIILSVQLFFFLCKSNLTRKINFLNKSFTLSKSLVQILA